MYCCRISKLVNYFVGAVLVGVRTFIEDIKGTHKAINIFLAAAENKRSGEK